MTDLLATAFRFRVVLTQSPRGAPSSSRPTPAPGASLGDGAFQECSGLDMEMDVGEYIEGGRTNGVLQRVGRLKVSRITLKRGMLHPVDGTVNTALWTWFQEVVDGVRPIRRYDGTIQMLGDEERVVAKWVFTRGLPAKIVGPQLNARTGEIAIEELQIAHEGLRMEISA